MKKVIISIVTIILVAICATVIALALIPVGSSSDFKKPWSIKILNADTMNNTKTEGTYEIKSYNDKDKERFNKVYELFEKGFKQNLLTAIFRGQANSKVETFYEPTTAGVGRTMTRNYGSTDKFTIIFEYSTSNQPKISVKDAPNSSYSYKFLFFEVDGSRGMNRVVFGVLSDMTLSTSTSTSSTLPSYRYYYTANADFKELSNYLKTLNLKDTSIPA